MKFFWFRAPHNYGDVLTPYLCAKLGVKCDWAPKDRAQALMVGSIANHARPGMNIYGSGFIRRSDPVCPTANYLWVRGPISRQKVLSVGGSAPELYGDAALILPDFIPPAPKMHDIGYVPHHVDHAALQSGPKVNLLTPDLEAVTRAITSCRKVISSSLHGIIVAHAYGIPAAWVKYSDKLTGDSMKFHDHYQSVGLEAILSTPENPVFQVPTSFNTDHIHRLIKGE